MSVFDRSGQFEMFRVTVTSRCPMDLAYFPMDVQACELRIASWGYTSDDITYQWKYDPKTFPIVLAQDITLSNFRVINFTCRSWDRSLSTGEYLSLNQQITLVYILSFMQSPCSWREVVPCIGVNTSQVEVPDGSDL